MSEETRTANDSSPVGERAALTVTDVGGIEHAEVEFPAGITTLAGANASNRSSLLKALNESLGGTMGSIRRGANDSTGRVELTLAGETYQRTLEANTGDVLRGGHPYSSESALVDLYVSLLEPNAIRRLVKTADPSAVDAQLADLLMAPVDVEGIQQKIEQHQERKEQIETKLESIETAKAELPELDEQRQVNQSELERLEVELEEKRDQLTTLDVDHETAEQAEEQLDALQAAQEEYRDIETTIERRERRVEAIEQELSNRRDALENVEEQIKSTSSPDDSALHSLEDEEQRLQRVGLLLDNLAETGRMVVNPEQEAGLSVELDTKQDTIADIARLFDPGSQATACPLCNNPVQSGVIRDRVEILSAAASEYYEAASDIAERQDELRSQRQHVEELGDERDNLQSDIRQLEHRLTETKQRIEELEDARDETRSEVDELQERVEELQQRRSNELETLYDEIAELQGARVDVEANLERIDNQIAEHESTIGVETDLRDELADIESSIEEQREHITQLETRVQDAATTHMTELVERLDYAGLAGIHLEREPTEHPVGLSEFRLVVKRRQQDGTVVDEDDLGTLSESERSLVGLVVALAGYVAHDVADEVPFLLLDSLEAFDTDRIDRLLDYVRDAVDVTYIVTALLSGDADAVDAEDAEISADAFI
jgi:predicted RNase H-like nuclease (RuvC/YqgF family)